MYYLTKAGVNFLNEAQGSFSQYDKSSRDWVSMNRQRTWSATNRPSTRAVQTPSRGRGRIYRGPSSDSPGHEKRMEGHIKRIAKDQPSVRYTISKG